ncbi:MAG TPA: hypothetical protein VJM34_01405, partial [Novosphingobium sp.]|nr:hypothetical protein [Novosphingobium sp.]
MILGTSLGKKKRGLFDPPEPWQTPGIGDGLPGNQTAVMPAGPLGAVQTTPALPDSNSAPEMDPMVRAMIGNAPEQPKRFWQGGNKFRALDGVAAALAVIGDTLDPQK